jgi:hypothetical protein
MPDEKDHAYEQRVTEAVHEIISGRTIIEQVKGMLMLIHGIDQHAAFEVLRSRARSTNSNVRSLAQQFLDDVAKFDHYDCAYRQAFDQIFLTAHERVGSEFTPEAASE